MSQGMGLDRIGLSSTNGPPLETPSKPSPAAIENSVKGDAPALSGGDLAHLLLLQQQTLMHQQTLLQHLTDQLGQPRPTGMSAASPPPQLPPAQPISVPNDNLWPVTSSSAPLLPPQNHLPTVPGGGNEASGILSALLSSGGTEALNHLVSLGLGTLMAAQALRQQGGAPSADTLAAAQLQVAALPSTQTILSSLLDSAAAASCAQGMGKGVGDHGSDRPASLLEGTSGLAGGGRSSSGSGSLGGGSNIGGGKHPSVGYGLGALGTPSGSMSDLAGLLVPGGGGLNPSSSPTAAGLLGHSPGMGMNRFNSGLMHVDSLFGLSDLI